MKETTAVTKYGKYAGRENDQGVIEFKGIPYSQPPKRWKERCSQSSRMKL